MAHSKQLESFVETLPASHDPIHPSWPKREPLGQVKVVSSAP